MPGTDTFTVQSTPVQVGASVDEPRTIKNIAGGTMYYHTTDAVSSVTNTGNLTAGQSLTFTAARWFICLPNLPASVSVSYFTDDDIVQVSSAPQSGTGGTLAGRVQAGGVIADTYGVQYFNEGTIAAPYWTPTNLDHPKLFGANDDWRGSPSTAVTDTGAANLYPSGVRVFGQGMTETDSGAAVQAAGEGNINLRLTTTDEVAHTAAIGLAAGTMQPDQHQLLVVDAELTHVSAITLRGMGIGFVGTAADAFDPPVTCGTTTTTLVQDDLALLHFHVSYTDTTSLFVAHNKSDEAASHAVIDSGADIAAAATYQRFRVEVNASGVMRCFVDKALVYTQTAAVDADEELSPVLYLESTSTAVKSMDVRRFATYAYRTT